MKNNLYLIVFLFVTTLAADAQSKDENEVAAAVDKLNKAIVNAGKTSLEELTAPALSYGHSGGKIENKSPFIELLASGSVDFLTIGISGQTIRLSGKSAIVPHIFSAKLVDEGKPVEIKIGVMMVWQKDKGKWKLPARQGYKL